MDHHEIKELIRQGKACAKKKDYVGALNAGKTVLRYEDNNFAAIVLIAFGLSMKDPVKSLEYYKKGAKLKPNEVACWQGITQFYENKGDKNHPDLLEAYSQLISLFDSDEHMAKRAETMVKKAGSLQSQGDFSGSIKVLGSCIKSCGHNDKVDKMVVAAAEQLKAKKVGDNLYKLSETENEVYVSSFLALHTSGGATDENYKTMFKHLYDSKDFNSLQNVCVDLKPRFNTFYPPMEYLCRLYIENQFKADATEIHDIAQKLLKLYPSSAYGYLAHGKVASERSKYSEAIAWWKAGLESALHYHALQDLIKTLLHVWDFGTAEDYCVLGKKRFKTPIKFDASHCYALAGQEKWNEVRALIKTLEKPELVSIMEAKIALHEEHWEEYDEAVKKLAGIADLADSWELKYFRGFKSSETLSQLCTENPNNLDCLLKCGIQLMKLEDYENAILPFNQCLQISPGHPVALFHMAKLYKLDDKVETAKKLLSKAYETLPIPEIGSYLSDLYSELEDNESNKNLLLGACKNSRKSRSKWAWLRLGVLHLHLGEASEAVVALQSAVRTDILDCHIWEALADAYYARGSYEAALKAYNQCIKLKADPVYPRLRIGVINGHLGLEDMAVEALTALGDYVPALVELSKTWLQIATKRVEEGLDDSAVKAIYEGLAAATRAVKLDTKEQLLPLVLISRLTFIATRLNPEEVFQVPEYLLTPEEEVDHSVMVRVNMNSLLLVGIRVLVTALSKRPTTSLECSMHTDLAKLYYYLATKCRVDCVDKAVYHGKKAVSLRPQDFTTWNTLGVIAFGAHDVELAQHCFSKSLELNNSGNPAAWCNVGLLYLANYERLIGHQCLKEAQSSEPGYGRTWIAMGLVAEGYEEHREEAMDLFRHAFTIPDTHEFSALAYTEFLCKALQDEYGHQDADYKSKHSEAVSECPEFIARYNSRSPTATSLNVEGFVQLHARQYTSAVKSFRKAAARTTDCKEREIINQNLVVALVEAGEFTEVMQLVNNSKEHTFITLAAAAYASDKLGSPDTAIRFYEKARDMCSNSHHVELSDSYVGQASMAYKMGNHELTKTMLLKGCHTKQPNFQGYLALCSLGLLTSDIQLATSVLAEMTTKCQNEGNIAEITQLQAYCLVAQQPEPAPLRCILRKIHTYPRIGKLRRLLALHLINLHGDGVGARRHLLTAQVYSKNGESSLAEVALTYLIDGDYDNAIKYGKASLKMNVGDPASYAILVAILTARGNHTGNEADLHLAARLKNMVLASGRLDPGSQMNEWFNSVSV